MNAQEQISPAGKADGARELSFDFRNPVGEPSLVPPDGIQWRVFRNPIALIGI
ncbi:hypothetical protein [Sandaracinobacteroides hominis]|uniref:hypothetical protein n=1 Tax=Sandaracinobacteroides hominis TaxID=2780086 RepID=UPI0018F78FB1|nr:hypothetical protein [Sandaracinobacteroides hominis]